MTMSDAPGFDPEAGGIPPEASQRARPHVEASRRVAEKLGFTHLGPLDWRPEGGLGDFAAESYELRFSS